MKYLNLDHSEYRALLNLKRASFTIYLTISCICAILSYLILETIMKIGINSIYIILLLGALSLIIFIHSNKDYFLDLIKKEKRVYMGVLSNKSEKERGGHTYYVFNMDGNSFIVDKETFGKCNVGDIVEFHTSPLSKYLFKVELISEAA